MDVSKLPKWKSHKTVNAAKIVNVTTERSPEGKRTLDLTGGQVFAARNNHAIWSRYVPKEGDYLVVYEDGYISVSPAKAFEEGYSLA